MFLASNIGSFFNLLYQLIMLRLLSKDAFASLNSLLSLLVIISVPSLAFNIMVTKHISGHYARNMLEELRTIWQKLSLHTFLFSAGVLGLIIAFKQPIAHFLHMDSTLAVIILSGIFFLNVISSVINGGLQGLERYTWLGIITIAAGFLKLAIALVLAMRFPNSLELGLMGFLLPMLIAIALSLWPLRFLFQGKAKGRIDLRRLYAYVFPVLLVGVCFAVLTNMDMVLVKHFFTSDAQDYAIAQMIGKIILSIAGVIYVVMFSHVANLHARKEDSRAILKRSLWYTFAFSFPAVILYNVFPGPIFHILAGQVSPQAILLGRLFSLSMLFYVLSNVLFYYQLSVERYEFIKLLMMMAAALIIGINLFHRTTSEVALQMCVISFAIFALNLKSAFKKPV